MQYTQNELFVLALIANKTKLIGYPSFQLLGEKEHEEIIEQLIKKQIVTTDRKLTDLGKKQIYLLMQYEEAKHFINIGGIRVSQLESGRYIACVEMDGLTQIVPLNKDILCASILTRIPNLDAIGDDKYRKKFIKKDKFLKHMEEYTDTKAIFYQKINRETRQQENGVLFVEDGYFNIYKINTEEMDCYPRKRVQKAVETLIGEYV
ncbi:uncharacterized protein DUF5081 [Breznakia blatticola]|uniref:Uncharacterized protein DUF5081 n=1 Tax=Breznakia blatticola TaxID=1754012 RepID=A0A4R7ZC15_9FIRM|nr:DUF5081 family protein [Breznakia blatticola]TDW09199.1 uncharacterized protein DUF5081 [Breznakia blatticola]